MTIRRLLHVNNASSAIAWSTLDAIRASRGSIPGAKLVNADAGAFQKLRNDYGAELLIARATPQVVQAPQGNPRAAGEQWFGTIRTYLASLAPHVDYVEVPVNEAYEGASEIGAFAEASARFVQLAADLGLRCIVGNFSTGTPEPQAALAWLPAMEAALQYDGAFGLHEYGLPNDMALSWHIGRWVHTYAAMAQAWPDVWRVPLVLTEFGIDGGNEGRPRAQAGWRAYYRNIDGGATAGAQYAAWLDAAIQEELDDDMLSPSDGPVLKAACLFNSGSWGNDWASFEVGDTPELAAWLAASPKESPVNEDLQVGEGVWRLMQERGDAPATNETYLGVPGAQWSITIGVSGCQYLCTERNNWAITVYEPR